MVHLFFFIFSLIFLNLIPSLGIRRAGTTWPMRRSDSPMIILRWETWRMWSGIWNPQLSLVSNTFVHVVRQQQIVSRHGSVPNFSVVESQVLPLLPELSLSGSSRTWLPSMNDQSSSPSAIQQAKPSVLLSNATHSQRYAVLHCG